MSDVVGVVATLKAKEGMENQLVQIFQALQAQVRANEPDCLMYDFFALKDAPGYFVVMEQYASAQALAAHGQMPHFRELGAQMGAALDGAPDVRFMQKIS